MALRIPEWFNGGENHWSFMLRLDSDCGYMVGQDRFIMDYAI